MNEAQELIKRHLTNWKLQIQSNLLASGEVTTGGTSEMLEVLPNDSAFDLWGWKYFQVWETGRKPGKIPPFDSDSNLYEWVKKRFPDADISFESLAYLIARRISIEGTLLYMLGGRKDIYSNVLTPENFAKLQSEIGGIEVNEVYKEFLKELS